MEMEYIHHAVRTRHLNAVQVKFILQTTDFFPLA